MNTTYTDRVLSLEIFMNGKNIVIMNKVSLIKVLLNTYKFSKK